MAAGPERNVVLAITYDDAFLEAVPVRASQPRGMPFIRIKNTTTPVEDRAHHARAHELARFLESPPPVRGGCGSRARSSGSLHDPVQHGPNRVFLQARAAPTSMWIASDLAASYVAVAWAT